MLYIVDECLKIYNNKFTIWFNKLNEAVGHGWSVCGFKAHGIIFKFCYVKTIMGNIY